MSFDHFDPNTRNHSHANAHALGLAAQLAYQDERSVERKALQWGFDRVEFFERSETQAFAMSNRKSIVVAFRGTEGKIKDWMTDLDIDLVSGPGGRVHEGFQTGLAYVWRDLYRYVSTTRRQSSRRPQGLWLTGHSLGAALATLCTAKLRLEKDLPVNGLYTFGQPRTGDGEFARNFNTDFGAQTYRYVNNNDIVTRVPFRSMDYSHVGRFRYFDSEGAYNSEISWWDKLLDRVKGRLKDVLRAGTDGIKDHSMRHYVKNLAATAEA